MILYDIIHRIRYKAINLHLHITLHLISLFDIWMFFEQSLRIKLSIQTLVKINIKGILTETAIKTNTNKVYLSQFSSCCIK